jgi:hypothetical protein
VSKISSTFTIKAIVDKHPLFVIHPQKAIEIDLARKKLACICFGNRKHYVRIKLDEEIDQENVMLSKELIDELHLPDYPIYEIRVKENKITIGPYIGLLISKADEDLTNSRLRKMMTYVKEYSRLHGAVVVFALNKVDTRNRLIEGYCYNPVKNYWQRGTFPYPSSIYRTIGLSKEWKNHFLSVIGDRIFNNQYFGKWKMYQWFSENTEIYPHIPYTTLYQSYHDVFDLLEKYKKLYIKPVLGLKGHRIVQVSMEEKNVFVFKYREQGINYEVTLENRRETKEFIKSVSMMENLSFSKLSNFWSIKTE